MQFYEFKDIEERVVLIGVQTSEAGDPGADRSRKRNRRGSGSSGRTGRDCRCSDCGKGDTES